MAYARVAIDILKIWKSTCKVSIQNFLRKGSSMNDMFLEMAIQQGYVPKDCMLTGQIVMGLVNKGEDPCKGCNQDRSVCGGRSKGREE